MVAGESGEVALTLRQRCKLISLNWVRTCESTAEARQSWVGNVARSAAR
jgi:hypothetical protein